MNLDNHLEMTRYVLRKNNGNNIDERSILEGCVANDLCSMTTEYSWLMNLDEFFWKKSEKSLNPLDYLSFYQSHWGELSALHCMANSNGEEPASTQKKVLKWLTLLEKVVHSCDQDLLETELNELTEKLGETVTDLQFQLSDVLDTKDVATAKNRAIGMILHIIEDSYTISHCQRDLVTGDILVFYCYDDQDKDLHSDYDEPIAELQEQCFNTMENTLNNLLDNKPVIFENIIRLSDNATTSIPGDDMYAK